MTNEDVSRVKMDFVVAGDEVVRWWDEHQAVVDAVAADVVLIDDSPAAGAYSRRSFPPGIMLRTARPTRHPSVWNLGLKDRTRDVVVVDTGAVPVGGWPDTLRRAIEADPGFAAVVTLGQAAPPQAGVTAACIRIQHDALRTIGGFDPRVPTEQSLADWYERVTRAGFSTAEFPTPLLKRIAVPRSSQEPSWFRAFGPSLESDSTENGNEELLGIAFGWAKQELDYQRLCDAVARAGDRPCLVLIDSEYGRVEQVVSLLNHLETFVGAPRVSLHCEPYPWSGFIARIFPDGSYDPERLKEAGPAYNFLANWLSRTRMSPGTVRRVNTSVIIPFSDDLEYTMRAVDLLYRNANLAFEIIAVDDGLHAESRPYFLDLQRQKGNVRVVGDGRNLGLTFAINQGLAAARGNTLLLLNDAIVPPNFLETMLAAMRRTGAGIVVPYSDNDTQGWEKIDLAYGSEVAATEAFATRLRMDRRGSGAFVHRAAASCLLLRREVLSKIGGFAPMFGFMVFADDDFLARAQIAGFKVFQAQDVFVHRLRNPEEVPDHLLRRNFDILMAKWLQNSDVDHKSREIPLSSMLGQAFHPQLHYEPLTLEELASQAEEIIETPSSIGVRFLVEPDWYEEGEEFEKVLRAFAALPVEPAASLLVRVDPLTVRYPERVIHDIASAVAGVQSEITPAHPVIIVNNFVSRVARGAVYRGADVFITTGKHGVRGLYEAEAKALGLVAIPADANLMRETLERWG